MTLLTLLQTFAQRSGLPVPAFVAASQDTQVLQMLAKLNEVLEDLTDRWNWEGLTHEAVFTSAPGEDQGALQTLAPKGYLRILNDTFRGRNSAQFIRGPISATAWQDYKSRLGSGNFPYYRFRGQRLLMLNVAAGRVYSFEYASSWAVGAATDNLTKPAFSADADVSFFSDKLLLAGLRWKWLSTKGIDYAEDFRRYEELANNAAGTETPKPTLYMNSGLDQNIGPMLLVPGGNWPIV